MKKKKLDFDSRSGPKKIDRETAWRLFLLSSHFVVHITMIIGFAIILFILVLRAGILD